MNPNSYRQYGTSILVGAAALLVIVGTIVFLRGSNPALATTAGAGTSDNASTTTTPAAMPEATTTADTDANNPENAQPAAVNGSILTTTPHSATEFSDGPLVSFSFDDGFETGYSDGYRILHAAGFPATYYIISTRVNTPIHVTKDQLLEMQAAGSEIADHTRSHPDLSKVADTQAQEEISGARQDLLTMGITDVSTFAYPYGGHGPNTPLYVKDAGLIGARSSHFGTNNDKSDPYLLNSYNLTASTTIESVEKEIDQVIAEKQWLIFEAHHIDETSYDNISSTLFQQIVDYVAKKQVPVKTVRDGLTELNSVQK